MLAFDTADFYDAGDDNDNVHAGAGNDTIAGGAGNDMLLGETGDDSIDGGIGHDFLNGGAGNDVLFGGEGNDALYGGGDSDILDGGAGNDKLFGDSGNDSVFGGAGADSIFGGAGNDALGGGEGADIIDGGTGNDTIDGGVGADVITGGVGNDTFIIHSGDGGDLIQGGKGIDTLVLDLTTADIANSLRADLAAYQAWMGGLLAAARGKINTLATAATGTTFTFNGLGVSVGTIENLTVKIDGVAVAIQDIINGAPRAAADVTVSTDEDKALSGNMNVDGNGTGVLSYAVVAGPASGTLTLDTSTGAYIYTPAANYHGADGFELRVTGANGFSATQTVHVSVASVNDAPLTDASVALSTDEEQAVSGVVSATDVDGDTLSFAVDQGPAHGSVVLDAATGAYTYQGATDFNGSDSFVISVSDGHGGTTLQTVTVGVAGVNDGPVAEASVTVAGNEDQALTGSVGASDVDGDTLSYSVEQGPQNGSLVLDEATGGYTYQGAENYNGPDSFVVRVSDGHGGTALQTVTLAIAAVNDGPVTDAAAQISTDENVPVSGAVSASDVDGDTLSFAVEQGPDNGSLVLDAATGGYTYQGNRNFSGHDTFVVRVSDGAGGSALQTVSVEVNFVNHGPVADAAVNLAAAEDQSIAGSVAASDADGDTLSYVVEDGPDHGVLVLDAATGGYTYQGAENYHGADSFVVRVSDAFGGSALQIVSVDIAAVNDAPVTESDLAIATSEDESVSGAVVASDADGDALTFAVATGPAHGALVLDAATGVFTYQGDADYNGSDSFIVEVSDGNGGRAQQTVSVGIAAVNDGPVTDAAARLALREDGTASGVVSAKDADGDALDFVLGAGPAHGSVSLDRATGRYTYAAAGNYSGADSFTVSVSDGHGGMAAQRVEVAVAAVADAPTLSVRDANVVVAGRTFSGTTGNDSFTGTLGNDSISGGDGNDLLRGDGGTGGSTAVLNIAAALTDTDGSETLSVSIAGVPSLATLSAGTRNADGTWSLSAAELAGLSIASTSAAPVVLTVTAMATEAGGGSATTAATLNVTFASATGSDTIDGGGGNDTIYGGAGANRLLDGAGNDLVYGQSGDDTFVAGTGNDTFDGGAGFDVLDMSGATTSVVVNLLAGTSSGLGTDRVLNFEGIVGSSYADTLTGNSANSRILAGAGDDHVYGNGGNDTLEGGTGNDYVNGGAGNDVISDGTGNDEVLGGAGDDYFRAGLGNNTFSGSTGTDTLDYSDATSGISVDMLKKTVTGWSTDQIDGIEKIIGTNLADTFYGNRLANVFVGGGGNDTFRGMAGADTYTGGAGNDSYMWLSKDIASGGGKYRGGDHITDFASGDTLNLHDLMAANPGQSVSSLIRVTDGSDGTALAYNIKGTYFDFVTLDGVHGATLSSLMASGMIVV